MTSRDRLAHAGLVHYQTYTCMTDEERATKIGLVLLPLVARDGRLFVRDVPDASQKRELAEIVGTAVAIELMSHVCPALTPGSFRKIPQGNRPGADYQIIHAGVPIVTIEAKGGPRAGLSALMRACGRQLAGTTPVGYAIGASYRYGEAGQVGFSIADPDSPPENATAYDELLCRLAHYVGLLMWSGFHQAAAMLWERVEDLRYLGASEYMNLHTHRLNLVQKVGWAYSVPLPFAGIEQLSIGHRARRLGPLLEVGDGVFAGFFLAQEALDALISQDFDRILEFRSPDYIQEAGDRSGTSVSARRDGSVLVVSDRPNPASWHELGVRGY